ncbi:PREDICTED: E3 ubiquitin-protein ligase TRAIP-like isoform X2 [Priapulus caudatus]|uniref:E3 ubiquitin-protein ligase TRAIP-like isoform X2 n=1 Tax=Priapulus caudatus TaxID=37621 RepID=A0ABM1DTA9_PRICU|nr:PREDICTED: E3 ubiquitin-protein ligase TRAIP-like isoform X2 [Priapulus caudatus]
MRGVCQICTEHFDATKQISAVSCGHTFHFHCVSQWLKESSTCPTCRARCTTRQLIQRLYFEDPGDGDGHDPDHLHNQLQSLNAAILAKDSKIAKILKENELLSIKCDREKEKCKKLQESVKNEKMVRQALKDQLRVVEKQAQAAEAARQDAAELRKRLTLYTRELAGATAGRKKVNAECTKLQKRLLCVENVLNQERRELVTLQEQLSMAENDLEHSESSIESLKKKVDMLMENSAVRGKPGIQHIRESSPLAERNVGSKRVRLSSPEEDGDKFCSPQFVKPSPATQRLHQACDEYTLPPLKIASKAKSMKAKSNSCNNLPRVSAYMTTKKASTTASSSSCIFKTGYDGLGGTSKTVKLTSGKPSQSKPIHHPKNRSTDVLAQMMDKYLL